MIKILFYSAVLLLALFHPRLVNAAPPSGNYLELNGGFIKAENNDLSSPAEFAFETWIKPNSLSGLQHLLTIGAEGNVSPNYQISINGGSLQLTYSYAVNAMRQMTTGNLSPGNWHHLAVTISSSSTKIFINGVSSFSAGGATQLKPLGPSIIFGGSGSSSFLSGNSFKGSVDQIRVSRQARDIAGNWQNGIYLNDLTSDNSTVFVWNFNSARGSTEATDDSQHIYGLLIGGDSKIHYYGALPTPTPFVLPTLKPLRSISLFPKPTVSVEDSSPYNPVFSFFGRDERPVYRR